MSRRFLAIALLVIAVPAQAQSLKDRLKSKVSDRTNNAAEGLMDKMLDRIEKAVKCVAGDDECVEKAKKAKKDVVLTDEGGKILPADEQPEGSPAANEKANKAAREGVKASSAGEEKASAPAANEAAWENFDFVPGSRVLFSEDFKNERVGNFPRRLEMLNGNAQVVEWKGSRWLSVHSDGLSAIAIALPETLPARWTLEMDVVIPWNGSAIYAAPTADKLGYRGERKYPYLRLSGTEVGMIRAQTSDDGSKVDPRTPFPEMFGEGNGTGLSNRPYKLRMETDGNYTKVYLDQVRIANIPNASLAKANKLWIEVEENGNYEGKPAPMLIGNISINAGGKDMYDALLADGRLAVQGIYFDTNSDVIRPESTGTLKKIGDMLTDHADLKLTIEGHTDNTGNAAANQTLSEKRAAAVVAYLTKHFGVSASRLASKGFGPSKPAASNDTAEGRQANRRVELVKMQ